MKTAKIIIQGDVYKATLNYTDGKTYAIPVMNMTIDGKIDFYNQVSKSKFDGQKVAIFENGEKFLEWI